MKAKYYLILPLLLLLSPSQTAATDLVTLVVAGTGDSQSLLKKLASAFRQTEAGRDIIIQVPDSIGSSGGIKALIAGQVSLARTARPLKEKEQGHKLQQFRFALSPVVIAAHPSAKQVHNISSQQLIKVYEGHIGNWDQLGGASSPIYVIDRETGDSSRDILEKHLAGFPKGRTAAKIFYTTPEAVAAIADHQHTLGFLPLSVAKARGLKVFSIDGVKPTEDNVTKGSYKYVTPFYIVAGAQPGKAEQAFIDFLYSEQAKKVIHASGSVPAR